MPYPSLTATGLLGTLLILGACSSSFGSGGSSPPATNTVVLPSGERVVCSDGSRPPCP